MSADLLDDTQMPQTGRQRRILSLWFPRLAAERVLRQDRILSDQPLAVVRQEGNMRLILAVSEAAQAQGAFPGQALQEALSIVPGLITRAAQPEREREFLTALRRWAGKFSPWVAEEDTAGLLIDLTGCAHLFGGEAALLQLVSEDCAALGLTVRAAIADTAGAAWALARYGSGQVREGAPSGRSGDAIDQEARATRSRAVRRKHWERGGPAPEIAVRNGAAPLGVIAPPGQMRRVLSDLPVAALRIDEATVTGLGRLGLRRIGDLTGMARAALARRFGHALVRRLDQALGLEPEPISPAEAPLHFAARLSLPEPIGLEADITAALERLLPVLCAGLRKKGRGARRVALEISRVDGGGQRIEIGLARPSDLPDRIRPLFDLKIGDIDPGFGIDRVRVVADQTEPLHRRQMTGGWAAAEAAAARQQAGGSAPLDDLIGRLGARIGLEAITRLHPAESHIPEKTEKVLAAAWSDPAQAWPKPDRPRPLTLYRPEPIPLPDDPHIPDKIRWRGQDLAVLAASGPERIAPEWWLDDPEWRSGVRDYWRVDTEQGVRLWLFYAHGAGLTGGWFAQGDFG
ncbi:MAG: DNA polymerase Y family protein [Pseudomonadota bacterium]